MLINISLFEFRKFSLRNRKSLPITGLWSSIGVRTLLLTSVENFVNVVRFTDKGRLVLVLFIRTFSKNVLQRERVCGAVDVCYMLYQNRLGLHGWRCSSNRSHQM